MDISLTPNLENVLKSKVAEGLFASMEEAVTFALEVIYMNKTLPKNYIKSLNAEIEKGWQEMEAGKGRSSEEVFNDLRKRYV